MDKLKLKAGLHYGDNRSKLVHFKEQQLFRSSPVIFCVTWRISYIGLPHCEILNVFSTTLPLLWGRFFRVFWGEGG